MDGEMATQRASRKRSPPRRGLIPSRRWLAGGMLVAATVWHVWQAEDGGSCSIVATGDGGQGELALRLAGACDGASHASAKLAESGVFGAASELGAVTSIDLSNHGLDEVPSELTCHLERLTSLLSLNLGGNALTSLPSELGLLTQLTLLNVASNELTSVPSEVGELHRTLRLLGLKGNKLASLPPAIGRLTSLEGLFLTDNHLEALPTEMGRMSNLRKLQAASNRLQSLPSQLGRLQNLELLRVPMNRLHVIPDEIFLNCGALAWLAISGNPMSTRVAPQITVPEIHAADLAMVEGGVDLADPEFGGAGNDGVMPAVLDRSSEHKGPLNVVLKYFAGGVGPDGDPLDELRVTYALNAGIGGVGASPPSAATASAAHVGGEGSVIVQLMGGLAFEGQRQIGHGRQPRRAAVYRLVEDGRPLAKKPLDRWVRSSPPHEAYPATKQNCCSLGGHSYALLLRPPVLIRWLAR